MFGISKNNYMIKRQETERRSLVQMEACYKRGRQLPLSSMRLLVPPMRLMSAFMWEAAQQRNVEQYGKLAEFISLVTEMVPELLSFKQRAQLILGLRARLILEMLQSGPYDGQTIQEHLNHVQLWTINSMQGEGQEEEVTFSTLKFVEMVRTLLNDLSEKEHFFKEVFPIQYGARFDTALQILEWEFFSRLEEFLPVPSFSQITSSFYLGPLDSDEFEQFFSDPEDLKMLLQHHKRHKTLEKNQFSFKLDTILSTLASKQTSEVCKDEDDHTFKNNSGVENQQKVERSLETCKEKGERKTLHQKPSAEELTQESNDEDSEKGSNKAVGSNLPQQQGEQSLLKYSPGSPEVDSEIPMDMPHQKHDCPDSQVKRKVKCLCSKAVHSRNNMIQCSTGDGADDSLSSSSAPGSCSVKKTKKHICPHCGKNFTTSCDMKRHRDSVHVSVKLFICNQCEKRFKTKRHLKNHLKIHTGHKPHVCSYCTRAFRSTDTLKSHERTHTGERPFACTLCDKKFTQMSILSVHLRMHREERPFLCSDCGKTFCNSSGFLVHSRLHTGERPYHCDFCGKNYITLQRLKAHQRYHTGERPYPCTHCEKCFHSQSGLKRHIKTHTGEKPFQCPKCDKRFSVRFNMRVHLRSHR